MLATSLLNEQTLNHILHFHQIGMWSMCNLQLIIIFCTATTLFFVYIQSKKNIHLEEIKQFIPS